MNRSLSFYLLISWILLAHSAFAEPEPVVKQISKNKYQIGKITIDKETREISFPALTHITDTQTIIEYLITHSSGEKIHETLLTTEAKPIHINIAFKLLNYTESKELFSTKVDHEKNAQFSIHVTTAGQTTPITTWLQHRDTRKPMPITSWIYHGSSISNQKFMAELNGNIFSIITEPSALASYSGADREDDTLWFPAKHVPQTGAKVLVTVKPWPL